MEKEIIIPEGYKAKIEGNRVILVPKEGEDERARKWLYEYIKAHAWRADYPILKDEALAYLEKQKEQNSKSTEDVIKEITKDKESAIIFLKSAGIMDENGELAEIYRQEQKPVEWSEEDEEMFREVATGITFTKNHFAEHGYKDMAGVMMEAFDWFKALRNRIVWKPSEEQMNALNTLNCHGDLSYVGQQEQLISLYQDLKKLM